MAGSIRQWISERLEELEGSDDDEGIILASEAGAKILSYTGVHAWDAGARHELSPIEPLLRTVFQEVNDVYLVRYEAGSHPDISDAATSFLAHPTMDGLVIFAEKVSQVCSIDRPRGFFDESDR
jgi:hypothetical protein